MHAFSILLFWLIVGHALADFPLQGDYMAQAKNRRHAFGGNGVWLWVLPQHAIIHAGLVAWITGDFLLAAFEFLAHFAVDYQKCENKLSFAEDQLLHISFKVCWAFLATIK